MIAPDGQVGDRGMRRRPSSPAARFARFSSRRVIANQRSLGMSFALFIAIRQFVLHGFPTTRTRTRPRRFFEWPGLADENLAVDPEQIFSFHPRFARHAADQQRPIDVAKTFIEIGGRHHSSSGTETRNRPVPSPRL